MPIWAQKWNTGTATFMVNIGNRWELVVDAKPRPFYYLKRASVYVLDP